MATSSSAWAARGARASAGWLRRGVLVSTTAVVLVGVAVVVVGTATLVDEGSVLGWTPPVPTAITSPEGGAGGLSLGDVDERRGEVDEPDDVHNPVSQPDDPAGPTDPADAGATASDNGAVSADSVDGAAGGSDQGPDDAADQAADEAAHDDGAEDAADEQDEPVFDVEAQQERLRELGYLVGPVDGQRGQQTVAAIMAFQRVHGLTVDGVVGPQTLGAFADDPVEPTLAGGPPTRIEIDLDEQLLHVVEDGERVATLHVSSGNGGSYRTASGGWARGRTPIGEFTVLRRINGTRVSRLGTLYDPLYFYAGFAIHGSNSVPPYPASHGCVRIARADARWLIGRIETGTPVHLYGGTHVFTPSR